MTARAALQALRRGLGSTGDGLASLVGSSSEQDTFNAVSLSNPLEINFKLDSLLSSYAYGGCANWCYPRCEPDTAS